MDNIFKIPNPGEWGCRVTNFSTGHGLVKIRLINKWETNGPSHLEFSHVTYFSGWMSWKGADFRLATNDELVALLRRVLLGIEEISDAELLGLSRFGTNSLFICNAVDTDPIYIVSNGAWSLDAKGVLLVEPLISK